jgi:hypothetical protein
MSRVEIDNENICTQRLQSKNTKTYAQTLVLLGCVRGLEEQNFPNLRETSALVKVSQTCKLPLEPPRASKKGASLQKLEEKIAPTLGLLDAMHVG